VEKAQAWLDAGVARVAARRAGTLSTPGPLPPPDAPLTQTYHELKARADAGDGAAASRLFDDLRQCFRARQQARTLPVVLSFHAQQAPDRDEKLSAEQTKARDARLADLQRELAQARQQAAQCESLSAEQMQLAPAALAAARLGDTAASDCYVSGLLLFTGGLLDHPEWLAEYKDNALTIANNALAAGDWAMVDQLQRTYGPVGFRIGPLADLLGEDPAMNYRLLRLQRLGAANNELAENLDQQIATAAQDLPADAISAGDAWAQDTFNRYFSNSPREKDVRNMHCSM
jgi:hypothetical protein